MPAKYSYIPRNKRDSQPFVRCHLTKSHCIIVGIIMAIVLVAVIITLAVGLPALDKKLNTDTTANGTVVFPASPSNLLSYSSAAAVSDGVPCSEIGTKILQQNGTAVDAAIAMLFCDELANPVSMGIGGGFLMTIYIRATKTSVVIDAREEAPAFATRDMYESNVTSSTLGGMAIAVPGQVKGMWLAHEKYGKLNWSTLIEPTIKLCHDGVAVSKYMAESLQLVKKVILNEPSMREVFVNNATGDVLVEGDLLKRHKLGETLERIARLGATDFYEGDTAKQLVADISNFGGNLTLADLKSYEAHERPAASATLKNGMYTLHTAPPPGSGPVLAFILNLMGGYNYTKFDDMTADDNVLFLQRLVESFKFGYARRTLLGDPGYVNVTGTVNDLLSREYADSVRKLIFDNQTFDPKYYSSMDGLHDAGTAQMGVVAANGDAVSVTSTINSLFGCKRRSSSTGIVLNDEMDDFSSPNLTNIYGLEPSRANFIEPRKRPLSSMSPSILVDANGDVKLLTGGIGGSRIITAIAQVILRSIWLGEDIKAATDALKLHHQHVPNKIFHEKAYPSVYLDALQKIGHELAVEVEKSAVYSIMRDNNANKWQVMVDDRKGGSGSGY